MSWNENISRTWTPGDGHVSEAGYATSGIIESQYPSIKVDENTTMIEFLETPSSRYSQGANMSARARALPEKWAFTNPHFVITLPIPEAVMTAFSYKAVLFEVYIGITPSVDGDTGKKTVDDPQLYDENSQVWDFQVDVGRIASLASVALLQRIAPNARQLRYKALINMILYAAYPNPSFDVTFRLACKSSKALKDVVYHHTVVTDYVLSSLGLSQRVLPAVGWSFLPSEDVSDDDK